MTTQKQRNELKKKVKGLKYRKGNFIWAIEKLLSGECVRNKRSDKEAHMYYFSECSGITKINSYGEYYEECFDPRDLLEEEFEIYVPLLKIFFNFLDKKKLKVSKPNKEKIVELNSEFLEYLHKIRDGRGDKLK